MSPPPAKKSFGQHFLSDPSILARIADALGEPSSEPVLEIGPGRGALTAELAGRGWRVVAIERDPLLVPDLAGRWPNVRVVGADALAVDWRAAVGVGSGERWHVIGNIPYNITSPLLDRALDAAPTTIVYLVQKEVALRLAAAPGSAEYGALTVGVRSRANVERLFTVPAGAFRPRPRVDSALIRLRPIPGATTDPRFRRLVVALFGARRKQLTRGLRSVLDAAAEEAGALVAAAGLDGARRPETLDIGEFHRLFRAVVDAGRGDRLTL